MGILGSINDKLSGGIGAEVAIPIFWKEHLDLALRAIELIKK